jgi:Putative beta-barrel porin-2, OmpL-like. bbp2
MTRSRFRSFHTAVVTTGLTAAFSSVAFGQEAVPPVAPPPPPPPVVEPAPPPPPPVVYETAPVVAAPPAVETTAAEPEEPKWYEGLSVGAFVDAYAAIRSDSNEARVPVAGQGSPGGYGHEAYVQGSGFGLAFAGADLNYSAEKFGATISMRFGPGVNRFYAADQGAFGIDNITQGFLTYKPTDKLTLDLGQFYTIYGAEVAESWRNVNYSRGALYYSMQPFWHTGLRANYKVNDVLAVNALVVNGVNTAFEGNKSPSLGLQFLVTPGDYLSLAVGYLGGLNPRDGDDETLVTKNFQDFFDVVATANAGNFKFVLNADLNLYKGKFATAEDGSTSGGKSEYWWGISGAPAYAFTDWYTLGARVEYLEDSANSQLIQLTTGKAKLTTITITTDFKPIPDSTALILRPEFRYELAGSDVYNDGGPSATDDVTDKFWSLHLGAVVTSMK